MAAKKKIDRYRGAKCPACGRMMNRYSAYLLWSKTGRSPIYGPPKKPLNVWVCLNCNEVQNV